MARLIKQRTTLWLCVTARYNEHLIPVHVKIVRDLPLREGVKINGVRNLEILSLCSDGCGLQTPSWEIGKELMNEIVTHPYFLILVAKLFKEQKIVPEAGAFN